MSKDIVFCADGVWGGPDLDVQHSPVRAGNVYQLFVALRGEVDQHSLLLANEQEKTWRDPDGEVLQVAKYIHGVGDPNNPFANSLDGAFGARLIVPVVRGYTFISRHYQPGDRIWLIGFSRGAYTVRALADMILSRGLLDSARLRLNEHNKPDAWRRAAAVWTQYRAHAAHMDGELLGQVIGDLPGYFCEPPRHDELITDVPVEAVAAFETVGKRGIPTCYEDVRTDVFRFESSALGTRIKYGLQALAIDEERIEFEPVLWDFRDRILQVLFAGIHEDIGGGYDQESEESALANTTLRWMRDVLSDLGLPLDQRPIISNGLGPLHCNWFPPTPWQQIAPRRFSAPVHASLMIHQSVIDRIYGGSALPFQSPVDGLWKLGEYQPASLRKHMTAGGIPKNWSIAY
ncbi:DUF2235 domain-containing protein [Atlantibacter subterranea]|uniref:phospholipase effector Tle1 domain-containing protein n=1 Tax=Atlantibacter subterraneus TaxID=255519 RepID=UPI00118275DB|nr:DUF2235 domain-containing protein [Atlantibacter subterranea]TSJ55489.1 DUF2235 domain-containing protein [Atlantibacter subterranea]